MTWLHSFYSHDKARTVSQALRLVNELNRVAPNETHLLLDAYFSPGGALRVLIRALRSAVRSLATERYLRGELSHRPALEYWPLLRLDFARAFRGLGCLEGLYFAECFDKALSSLPRQSEGLYLLENQGWERALASAWRRCGHGRLAGVAHSTIRFWDLRYHRDPRHYDAAGREPYSGPDVVIVNGQAARAAYLSNATRRETLVECEALRYLHLRSSEAPARQTREAGTPVKVLVVGDYLRSSTEAVLGLLEAACRKLEPVPNVCLKPHPNCLIDPAQFPPLNLSVEMRPVATVASECDVVLAGNLTSAAVDAYASGARVLVHEDGGALNYSPLRGVPGVLFVRTAEQLANALRALDSGADRADVLQEYFYLDPALRRWRRYFTATPVNEEVAYAAS
jgi:surface carbohydrate biosynthesis protein (TIGR04326 family)